MSHHPNAANNELIGLAVRLGNSNIVAVTPLPKTDSDHSAKFTVRVLILIDSIGAKAVDLKRATDIQVLETEQDVAEDRIKTVLDRLSQAGILPVFHLLRVASQTGSEPLQYQWRCTDGNTSAKFMLVS